MDNTARLHRMYILGRQSPQWDVCCVGVDNLLCYNYPLAEGYELWQAISESLPDSTLADLIFIISNAADFEAAYGQLRKGMRILLCVEKELLGTRGFIAHEISQYHYEITVMDWPHFFYFLAGLNCLTMTVVSDTVIIDALPNHNGLTRHNSG